VTFREVNIYKHKQLIKYNSNAHPLVLCSRNTNFTRSQVFSFFEWSLAPTITCGYKSWLMNTGVQEGRAFPRVVNFVKIKNEVTF